MLLPTERTTLTLTLSRMRERGLPLFRSVRSLGDCRSERDAVLGDRWRRVL